MSKISGSFLGRTPATDAQTIAVATALGRLHHSVPDSVVATLPVRVFGPEAAVRHALAHQRDLAGILAEAGRRTRRMSN